MTVLIELSYHILNFQVIQIEVIIFYSFIFFQSNLHVMYVQSNELILATVHVASGCGALF